MTPLRQLHRTLRCFGRQYRTRNKNILSTTLSKLVLPRVHLEAQHFLVRSGELLTSPTQSERLILDIRIPLIFISWSCLPSCCPIMVITCRTDEHEPTFFATDKPGRATQPARLLVSQHNFIGVSIHTIFLAST